MLVVETVGRIRREHFAQGKSIKEIARDLRISRNTVRKILRSGETSFAYERDVQPQPKLGHWKSDLDRMLAENAAKPTRERLTLIRLFEDLHGLGYAGGYDAVRRYARSWQREHASQTAPAFVPLSFAPGEAYQFDWSHEIVLLNGVTVTVKVAHMRLCHSRMMLVRAYPRESQEMVFDAHERAFAFFKGGCTRGIYDNMKTAVEAIYDPWHYVPVLARKPGALRNGAPFKDWVLPPALERVRRKLTGSNDGDRQMVAILAAVLTDGLPAVETACAQAMADGVHSADVIINILARRRDPAPAVTVLTPEALALRQAPIADCARYDQLRSTSPWSAPTSST